ncbi:MAG: Gfo/Idh/MocA family protein [Roseburia sp.]
MKRVGIVGCGGIANVHAWALSQTKDVEIAATADCISKRAEKLSMEFTNGKAKVYLSLEEMLKESNLDVLHICTPHNLHVPMAIKGLKSGVAVFCEKPPAISDHQFEELVKVVKDTENRIGFCFQNRYNTSMKKTEEILKSGELGALMGARAFVTWRRDEEYYETDWKGTLDTEGGGVLMNQSIHTLDLMLQLLGEPVMVKASIHNHHLSGKIQVEDTVEAWMSFKDGKRACFYASNGYATDAPVILECTCERGSITLLDQMVLVCGSNGREQFACPEPKGIGKSCWGSGHLKCIRDFYEKLETGERFQNDLAGVKNTMETVMKIYGIAKGDN